MPFSWYFAIIAGLTLMGLGDSIYLSISHYRVYTDIGYSSFCAISKSINCDTVSQSPFSILMHLPVPLWGVVGYTVFFLLLLRSWVERDKQKGGWALLQLMALLFSFYSIVLALISTFYIRSYCIMCIVSYGINFLLVYFIWIIRKRFQLPPLISGLKLDAGMLWHDRATRWVGGGIAVAILLITPTFPTYWETSAELSFKDLHTGYTEEGHPWIGAISPTIEITEYTDYLCFQCRKMHYYLRRLVASHPDRIRLIHRHFPMDHTINPIVKEPFHIGSGPMAILALLAAEHEKFWQMNDALFEVGERREEINLTKLSEEIGIELAELRGALSVRTDLHMKLAKDVWSGIRRNITGTPSFVIDGEVYVATIPPEIIRKTLE